MHLQEAIQFISFIFSNGITEVDYQLAIYSYVFIMPINDICLCLINVLLLYVLKFKVIANKNSNLSLVHYP